MAGRPKVYPKKCSFCDKLMKTSKDMSRHNCNQPAKKARGDEPLPAAIPAVNSVSAAGKVPTKVSQFNSIIDNVEEAVANFDGPIGGHIQFMLKTNVFVKSHLVEFQQHVIEKVKLYEAKRLSNWNTNVLSYEELVDETVWNKMVSLKNIGIGKDARKREQLMSSLDTRIVNLKLELAMCLFLQNYGGRTNKHLYILKNDLDTMVEDATVKEHKELLGFDATQEVIYDYLPVARTVPQSQAPAAKAQPVANVSTSIDAYDVQTAIASASSASSSSSSADASLEYHSAKQNEFDDDA